MNPSADRNRGAAQSRPFHHGNLRQALLDEATAIIADQGVEAFSLREAARRIGVSPNAAYRHFADKGALLATLAQSGFTALAASMEQDVERAGADLIARLKATGSAYLAFARREPALFNLMFGPYGAGSGQDVSGRAPHSGRTPYELVGDALDAMVEAGLIDAADRSGAQTLIWPAIHGLAVLTQARVLNEPVDEAFDRVFAFQMRALIRRAGPPA
jgi:AcrR family transcriptional regulator